MLLGHAAGQPVNPAELPQQPPQQPPAGFTGSVSAGYAQIPQQHDPQV